MERLKNRELRKQARLKDPGVKLSKEEIIDEGVEFMGNRGVEDARFVRYKKKDR